MQTDRRAYQKYELKNGISVFYLPMDIEIGQAIINIPFGHQNNIGEIPLGGFHFLEHCVLNRSQMFPEHDSFSEFIGKEGGYKNGTTGLSRTYFEVEVPSAIFKQAFSGLLSHIYKPIFTQADIDTEKGIIINERTNDAPFFPGRTEAGQYVSTEVFYNMPLSLEKIFGDDASLQKMDIESVKKLHAYYFTNKTTVFLGGNIDIDECLKTLEEIPTTQIELPGSYEPLVLINGQYHEKGFKETHNFEYSFFYLRKNIKTYEDFKARQLLFNVLTNSYTGKIYKWLRNEIGVYEIPKINVSVVDDNAIGLAIPLSSKDKVAIVRNEIDARIVEALKDDAQITDYVESIRRGEVFSFQTLDSRLTSIFNTYRDYGFPVTDQIANEMLNTIGQPGYLLNFYNKIKNEGQFGEMLIMPLGND